MNPIDDNELGNTNSSDPNSPTAGRVIEEDRRSYGAMTIWREDPGSARTIYKTLKSGGVVALLIDQDVDLENEFSPFFGLDAASPIGLIRFAVKLRLKIFTSFITRNGELNHTVHDQLIEYDPEEADVERKVLAEFNRRLEALIKSNPDQWIWWHRRWRRRPGIDYHQQPDRLRSSREYVRWLNESLGGSSEQQYAFSEKS